MAANKVVLLGNIIKLSKSGDILGISDRAKIIEYIERAMEIAEFKTNWSRFIGDLDICCDCNGMVTLPSFVDTVLACNVGGHPAYFRNGWFNYHINGPGARGTNPGPQTFWSWDDHGFSPVLQNIKAWSRLAAIVEDPVDGNGSLSMQVMGETVDGNYNSKEVFTIPTSGPSQEGVTIPLLYGYANIDPAATIFKSVSRVIKPITRGYVKLIAYTDQQLNNAVTLGYYGPRETQPAYRRIKVNSKCDWVRVRYRRAEVNLVDDTDIIPFPSTQATLDLIKAIRLRETNNIDVAEAYEQKAIELLNDIENIEAGPGQFSMQVDPGFGTGTIDLR